MKVTEYTIQEVLYNDGIRIHATVRFRKNHGGGDEGDSQRKERGVYRTEELRE
jgi:hypothetical protein